MSAHHRPTFHVRPATGWINDPNAPVFVDGLYHLFCQHNPGGAAHRDVHWAHFSSADLVHWTTHPIALAPTPGGPDEDGCWSGSAVLVDGRPWLVYSGNLAGSEHQTVCVARPAPDGLRWVKEPRAVLERPPEHADLAVFRDPFVQAVDGGYRMLVGGGYRNGTGVVLQYRSQDLLTWSAGGPFSAASDDVVSARDTGDAWECPQLLVDGDRALLVVSAWRHVTGPSHVEFVAGRLAGDRLQPDGAGRLDHGPDFYAPALTVDDAGRCLLWGWAWEARDETGVEEDGWAGLLTVPRELTLAADGTPRLQPASELSALREGDGRRTAHDLAAGSTEVVAADAGRALDLEATLVPGHGGHAWLRVLASPDGSEATEIGVDDRGTVYLSRDRASRDPGALGGTFRMPVGLDDDGGLDVRVLVDGSLVEVFAGEGLCLTARVYPESARSTGLVVGVDDAAGAVELRWWAVRAEGRTTAPVASVSPVA